MSREYWNKVHTKKYRQADWAKKPTIFATQVISYFPDTGTLLDIGTGQGQDAYYFSEQGFAVTATDFSEQAIADAKERHPEPTYICIDTSNGLPFAPEFFDVVYSHLALHYFNRETTQNIFTDIHRVLKPGGIFATITNTAADSEITEFGYEKIEPEFYRDPRGVEKRYFSVESMREYTNQLFDPLLLDAHGKTYKDADPNLIRFVGRKV